jgi:hypothetical protein
MPTRMRLPRRPEHAHKVTQHRPRHREPEPARSRPISAIHHQPRATLPSAPPAPPTPALCGRSPPVTQRPISLSPSYGPLSLISPSSPRSGGREEDRSAAPAADQVRGACRRCAPERPVPKSASQSSPPCTFPRARVPQPRRRTLLQQTWRTRLCHFLAPRRHSSSTTAAYPIPLSLLKGGPKCTVPSPPRGTLRA